jgi:hypothetical protein
MARYDFRYLTGTCGCHSGYTAADDSQEFEGFYFDDGDPDSDTFDLNEQIMLYDEYGRVDVMTYIGHTSKGVVVDYYGSIIVFGNRAYQAGDSIPSTADALAVCFYPGTLIATPAGPRAVETLGAGDLVLGADGTARPIRWMGRQSVTTVFADPLRSLPVTIGAGALGDGLPLRDLTVSPDHAVLIDGMLVHAGALVNGTSIRRMTDVPPHFTYWHIELDDHALVLAEGVAAVTYLDGATRRRFDNWAERPDAPYMAPLDLPRVTSARALPMALRRRLGERTEPLAA